ncbi:MAG: hypothetical protein INQ03_00625 [Candidatus Heimdallarchaeota archaeon]|nr:hypothetical protein [Candidatus Heimdallarchaeota archaeon]
MMPPICLVCGERFSPGDKTLFGPKARLVYFKETESDKEFNARLGVDGFVGHPSNAAWFCKRHIKKALSLRHLYLSEASNKIS